MLLSTLHLYKHSYRNHSLRSSNWRLRSCCSLGAIYLHGSKIFERNHYPTGCLVTNSAEMVLVIE